mmetsp:Transcript_75902/g.197474  ORF Transcript_75902/g.197474 Transcript_75902/m.197474 type:complete len:122 (-) Transcript_75902:135-500(-)
MVGKPERCEAARGGRRITFLFSKLSKIGKVPPGAPGAVCGTVTLSVARNQRPSASFPDILWYLAVLSTLPPIRTQRCWGGKNLKPSSEVLEDLTAKLPFQGRHSCWTAEHLRPLVRNRQDI